MKPTKAAIQNSSYLRFFLLALLLLGTFCFHQSSYAQHLDMAHFGEHMERFRELPPWLYIIILILVPILFIPGLPFVVLGGLLYGKTWGLIYAMTGATLGAGASFLFSRYMAGEWAIRLLPTDRRKSLQEMTKKHGWKIVIALRLIPLFPFTPLNYSLGLTNIRFSHYMVATFIGIFPACFAFIFFSHSLWELLLRGGSKDFLIATLLLATVILLPLGYRTIKSRDIRKQQ